MNNKYYTPEIEEFRIGFEYEEFCSHPIDSNGERWSEPAWTKKIVKDYGEAKCNWKKEHTEDFIYIPMTGRYYNDGRPKEDFTVEDILRVKYLDEEDIKSLGFTTEAGEIPSVFTYYKVLSDKTIYQISPYWHMMKTRRENLVRIYKGVLHQYPYQEIFRGDIKNKSELTVLLKQLRIE